MKPQSPIFNLKSSEKQLLRLIRQHSPSRKELSRLSGLTAGAVTQYCRKLLFLGLIKETEKMVKKRGLPSFHLTLNPNACCSIGVTFSDNAFQLAIVDFVGNKIAHEHYDYLNIIDIDQLCQNIKAELQRLLEKRFLTEARILGIGFSLAGYLRADQSISSPWFSLLQNIPNLQELLTEKIGYPCYIENNINTIALGEYYSRLWHNINDMIIISLDFGIGAGVISQGRLIRGGFGNAGEVGLLFPYDKPRPSWQYWQNLVEKQGQVVNWQQDPLIQDWLAHSRIQLLNLILSAIAWLDPKVIVLTGMLPENMLSQFIDYINQAEEMKGLNRKVADLSLAKIKYEEITVSAAIIPIYHFLHQL